MARIVVLLTYDLATPPGLHDRFRDEMMKFSWQFKEGDKDLPATTCFAFFKEGISREDAVATTKKRLNAVGAILLKEDKGFTIKRSLILAMEEGHFKGALKDIS